MASTGRALELLVIIIVRSTVYSQHLTTSCADMLPVLSNPNAKNSNSKTDFSSIIVLVQSKAVSQLLLDDGRKTFKASFVYMQKHPLLSEKCGHKDCHTKPVCSQH